MSAPTATDRITIALAELPATDAFGLDLFVNGAAALVTLEADGPGIFRASASASAGFLRAGWPMGYLQRGPVLLPVKAPSDGWVLATAPDGMRVGHGSALIRYLPAQEGIVP